MVVFFIFAPVLIWFVLIMLYHGYKLMRYDELPEAHVISFSFAALVAVYLGILTYAAFFMPG